MATSEEAEENDNIISSVAAAPARSSCRCRLT
jgi:hypothetical protein